jgi:hypothetical protein
VARVGETLEPETLTLHFAKSARLGEIKSTPDFMVEPGGSCAEGNVYEAQSSCALVVRFTPQGPGHRLGKLMLTAPDDAEPMAIGLVGFSNTPVVSFTPAVISTVAASYPSDKGMLNGAKGLEVDNGANLYIADTGNNLVRYMDSSDAITTIAGGGSTPVTGSILGLATSFKLNAPYGVTTDALGETFISDYGDKEVLLEGISGYLQTEAGGGTKTACSFSSPCPPREAELTGPEGISVDSEFNIFFIDQINGGYAYEIFDSGPDAADMAVLLMESEGGAKQLLVDNGDDLYSDIETPAGSDFTATCLLLGQNEDLSLQESGGLAWVAAGTQHCGFNGDGGQSAGAEIGAAVGQMSFDLAGNLYFSDTDNQRVRRIDATTGIIHTIAGDGTAGYTGDGGAATAAELNAPTGVAVDSQGQVYIISGTGVSTAQVVRKVGPNGILKFAAQLKGTASAAQTFTIANTGNADLAITNVVITGADAADFKIDPDTTSCNFAAGNSLANGASCQVGVIFTPSAGGTLVANLTLLDNTVNNSNTVNLSGTGTLPSPTLKITSPAAGASFTSGTSVKFSVTVTSSTAPAPTETVKFSVDGVEDGSPVTLSAGAASVTLTGLSTKAHSLTAAYSGDTNYAAVSASENITITAVKKTPAVVRLSARANPATSTTPLAFSVEVTSSGAEPQGEVELHEGETVLARAALNKTTASLSLSKLDPGTHVLTAVYSGDSEHDPSTSAPLKEVVK